MTAPAPHAPSPTKAPGPAWLPGLRLWRGYERNWLRHDLAAGLVLSAVLVPVGLAYAAASGVPAIAGLYATIFGLLAYAAFGPSRQLVLGPDSSLVPLVLGVVLPLAAGRPDQALAIASLVALVAGALCVVAGLLRLGFVTELLSRPIRYGYMNGIAITVLASQLPALFGFAVEADSVPAAFRAFFHGVAEGRTQGATLAIGVACVVVILLARGWRQLPGALLAIVGATIVVAWTGLDASHRVAVLGELPQGLPLPSWPALPREALGDVLLAGMAVALVAFADTSVLSRTYSAHAGERVSPNQEMVGLGAANLAAGLFQGIPVSASSSRTPVAVAAGAQSQLAGLVGALVVALLLLAAPRALQSLPKAALAAVVVTSALAMVELRALRRIWRIQRGEFWLSMACVAGVVALGPLPGIGLAIGLALAEFLWSVWRPHSAVLGRVEGLQGYHDVTRYPAVRRVPGLVLFRWDAPLFFANAEEFRNRVLAAAADAPEPPHWLVVGAEPITGIDMTAGDVLREVVDELRGHGVQLRFAELKDPMRDRLRQLELTDAFGPDAFFRTIEEAVEGYLAAHPEVDRAS